MDTRRRSLLGGGARVCSKRNTYPDGRESVGIGIQPDVVVNPLRQPEHEDPELARARAGPHGRRQVARAARRAPRRARRAGLGIASFDPEARMSSAEPRTIATR
jgi:hypothetical protein